MKAAAGLTTFRLFLYYRVLFPLMLGSVFSCAVPYPQFSPADLPEKPFPQSQYAAIQGTLLHYRLWNPVGPSRGKVLLIHGLGGSTFSFRYTAPALREAGYTVVAADIPPFGYSSRAKTAIRAPVEQAPVFWELLFRLEESGQVSSAASSWSLIGHSMGGQVITAMAASRPFRAASLVYIDGAVFLRGSSRLLHLPPAECILRGYLEGIAESEQEIAKMLQSAYGSPPSPETVQGYAAPLRVSGSVDAFIAFSKAAGTGRPPVLQEVTSPVLCLWGEKDTWVPPSQGIKLWRELPDAGFILVPGQGHCPMETDPKTVNALLLEFLGNRHR